jgi:hypothetical protein
MAIGPGKYDDLCTYVAEQAGTIVTGGVAIVIIVGGNRGSGFSTQADLKTMSIVPDLLEAVAAQIRADMEKVEL